MDELIKALRWCCGQDCNGCPLENVAGCMHELFRKAADMLESIATENKGLRENNESRKQTEEALLGEIHSLRGNVEMKCPDFLSEPPHDRAGQVKQKRNIFMR